MATHGDPPTHHLVESTVKDPQVESTVKDSQTGLELTLKRYHNHLNSGR